MRCVGLVVLSRVRRSQFRVLRTNQDSDEVLRILLGNASARCDNVITWAASSSSSDWGRRDAAESAAEARAPPGGSDIGATWPRRAPAPHRQEDFARRSTTRVRLSNRPAARKIAPSEFQRVLSPRPAPPSWSERRLALARSVHGTQWCD